MQDDVIQVQRSREVGCSSRYRYWMQRLQILKTAQLQPACNTITLFSRSTMTSSRTSVAMVCCDTRSLDFQGPGPAVCTTACVLLIAHPTEMQVFFAQLRPNWLQVRIFGCCPGSHRVLLLVIVTLELYAPLNCSDRANKLYLQNWTGRGFYVGGEARALDRWCCQGVTAISIQC